MYRVHRRASALFFTAVFSFVGWADASGLHLCPQHDALPVATSASGDIVSDSGPTPLTAASHAPVGSTHDDHEGPCTCVGSFDDEGSALQPVLSGVVFHGTSTARAIAARAESAILIPSQYRLPFANAPPHLT